MRCWIAVFLLTFACLRGVYAGDDIRGSADLLYRSTETKTAGKKDYAWSFDQVYNLGLTKEFTPKVSFTADLGVNVSENVAETDDTETDTKTTQLYPDMRLKVSNEYFTSDTGYRLTERGLDILTASSDEERFTTESLNTNFYTTLEKYPQVRLRYNQDKSYDRLSIHETNTQTNRFSGGADYAFRFLNFYYDYTNETSEDYVGDSTQEINTHDGRIDFRKSFWSNRVSSYGSYSINERKTETGTRGQDVEVAEQRTASAGLYIQDATPASSTLNDQPDSIDGDKDTTTGIEIGQGANTDQNIGLDLTYSTEIEKIYLYTTVPGPLFDKNAFAWAVYSSTDNLAWTLITTTASFDYSTTQKRFEIALAKTSARYFKVVNTANDGNALEVTEIEAYGFIIQPAYTTTKDVTTTETIQGSLGVRPFDWLSFNYDLDQNRQTTKETGADTTETTTETRRSRHDISGLLGKGFQVHKYLEVRPQYQKRLEYEDDSETETKRASDTYRVHFVSSPIETLNTDLSLTHLVLEEESETQSKTSSAVLHIAAKLREGADLDIDGDITRSENLSTKSELTSRSIRSNLRLELTSALTSEIEYNINWLETQAPIGDTTGRTSDAEVTFYWRPSHDFYFRGSYGIDRNEESGDQTSRQDYNLNWLLTKKIQLSMDYAIESMDYAVNMNDVDRTSFSSDVSWSLSRTFTLRFAYDWRREEADTQTERQSVSADLSARF